MSDAQTIERPEAGTDIAILGTVTALTVFGTAGGVDAILDRIRAQARAVDTDISSDAGRKAVASLAYKIARTKTALDGMGKELGEQNYRAWKVITAERSRIEAELDALRDEIRKPLTEYEVADKARIWAHEQAIDALVEGPHFYASDNSAADLAARLKCLEELPPRDWQEFAKRAADALANEIAKTKVALVEAIRREAAAEAAAKAAREEAQAAAVREAERQRQRVVAAAAQARQEAEDRARIAAEAEARRVADEAARLAAATAARAKADAEHLAAVERQKQEASERADRAEADRLAATAQARADMERAALAAERDRTIAVAQAAAAERQRIADAQAKDAAETAAREANKRHAAAVHNEALADLVAATEITQAAARAVVTAIVSGKVRHARIHY